MIIIRKKVAGVSPGALNRFAERAAAAAGVAGEVSVLLTSDRELQRLNRRFRKKNVPTDVLSFPIQGGASKELGGDIAISSETATVNSGKLGHSVSEEIKILILHGLLHLAGYDHESDNGTMARKEGQLRRAFKLPVGLLERHGLDRKGRAQGLKKLRRTT